MDLNESSPASNTGTIDTLARVFTSVASADITAGTVDDNTTEHVMLRRRTLYHLASMQSRRARDGAKFYAKFDRTAVL